MKKVSLFVLVVLLALLAAVPAYADPPTMSETPWEDEFVFVDCAAYGYDFQVIDHAQGVWSQTEFYNKDGSLKEIRALDKGTDTLFNSKNLDRSIAGPYQVTQVYEVLSFDPPLYLWHASGHYMNIHAPGGPLVQINPHVVAETDTIPTTNFIAIHKLVGRVYQDDAALSAYLAE